MRDIKNEGHCPGGKELFSYLKGGLLPDRSDYISRHLEGCPICADLAAGYKLIDSEEELEQITGLIATDIQTRLEARRKRPLRMRLAVFAAAASILLFVAIGIMVWQKGILSELAMGDRSEVPAVVTVEPPEEEAVTVDQLQPYSGIAVVEGSKVPKEESQPYSAFNHDIQTEKIEDPNPVEHSSADNQILEMAHRGSLSATEADVVTEAVEAKPIIPFRGVAEEAAVREHEIRSVSGPGKKSHTDGGGKGLRMVTGRVTDESGEPLLGVNILVPGDKKGAVTAMDGTFAIELPEDKDTLTFHFIGFISNEVNLNGKSDLSLAMTPDMMALNEVVVTGSGSRRRAGSANRINQETEKSLTQKSAAIEGEQDRLINSEEIRGYIDLIKVYLQAGERVKSRSAIDSLKLVVPDALLLNDLEEVEKLLEKKHFDQALEIINKWK